MNTQQKFIKTDLIKLVNKRTNIRVRNANAKNYIDECELKKQRRKEKIYNILERIGLSSMYILLIVLFVVKFANGNANENYTYSMQGNLQGNCVVLEDGNVHKVSKEFANYTSESMTVTVVLDNNGTEDRTDDKIINIY